MRTRRETRAGGSPDVGNQFSEARFHNTALYSRWPATGCN
jgi:hypothetical protein